MHLKATTEARAVTEVRLVMAPRVVLKTNQPLTPQAHPKATTEARVVTEVRGMPADGSLPHHMSSEISRSAATSAPPAPEKRVAN